MKLEDSVLLPACYPGSSKSSDRVLPLIRLGKSSEVLIFPGLDRLLVWP